MHGLHVATCEIWRAGNLYCTNCALRCGDTDGIGAPCIATLHTIDILSRILLSESVITFTWQPSLLWSWPLPLGQSICMHACIHAQHNVHTPQSNRKCKSFLSCLCITRSCVCSPVSCIQYTESLSNRLKPLRHFVLCIAASRSSLLTDT